MKKLLLILAVVLTAGALSSCSSHKNCPAYSKVPPVQQEQPA